MKQQDLQGYVELGSRYDHEMRVKVVFHANLKVQKLLRILPKGEQDFQNDFTEVNCEERAALLGD